MSIEAVTETAVGLVGIALLALFCGWLWVVLARRYVRRWFRARLRAHRR